MSTSKSPGVHIDGNLSWECHINEISKKITSGISAIKRIRYFLPFKILLKGTGSRYARRLSLQNKFVGSTLNSKSPLPVQSLKILRFIPTSVALAGLVILR